MCLQETLRVIQFLFYLLRNARDARTSYMTELKWLNSACFPFCPNKHCCTCILYNFEKSIKTIEMITPILSCLHKFHLEAQIARIIFKFTNITFYFRQGKQNYSKDFTVTDSYENKYKGNPKGECFKINPFRKTAKFHPNFFLAVKQLLLCSARLNNLLIFHKIIQIFSPVLSWEQVCIVTDKS